MQEVWGWQWGRELPSEGGEGTQCGPWAGILQAGGLGGLLLGLILPKVSISDFLMGKLRHGACRAGRGGEARMLSTMWARAAPSHHLPAHR